MKAISPSEEVKVCQTCGDEGFTNAFIYCVKCLEFVIHRYCLYVIPKTFDEHVIWFCESCKPTVQLKVTSPSHKNEAKKNIDPTWSESWSSDSDSDSSSSSSNMKEFDEWEARVVQQNQRIDRILDDMIMSYPNMILGDQHPRSRKRSRDGENCKPTQSQSGHCKKKEKKERDNASLIAETKEVISHEKNSENEQKTADCLPSKEKEHNVSQFPHFENNNYYTHGQPIIDPVWRGSFRVGGKDCENVFEGFVGHLSNKACEKVCEEANLLPSLLHLEMHPKTLLWPKSFQDMEPSDDHIAIYIFPGDPINERAFDGLVQDMMDGDLAMRAAAKNADLLIFTSEALPPLFRRFQGKYYLWGVFRGKRNAPTSLVGQNRRFVNDSGVVLDPESGDHPV